MVFVTYYFIFVLQKDYMQEHIKSQPIDTCAVGTKALQKETTVRLEVRMQSSSQSNGNDVSNDEDSMWC